MDQCSSRFRAGPDRVAAALVALLLLIASAPDALAQRLDLRVMSFNIRTGTANDGKDSWEHPNNGVDRRDLVVDTIDAFNPDILGLQEDHGFQVNYLTGQMPRYTDFGRGVYANNTGERVSILYRTSRFTKLRQGTFWLSDTPNTPSQDWGADFPRIVNWLELRDNNQPDLTFVVMNTHWEHAAHGATARQNSATLMRQKMAEIAPNLPIIFTGDFNADQGGAAYQRMVGLDNYTGGDRRDLVDTYRELHPGDSGSVGTTHPNFDGNAGTGRIDWILHDDSFRTVAATIDRSSFNNRYPSDHFPVTATLMVIPEPAALTLLIVPTLLLTRRRRAAA